MNITHATERKPHPAELGWGKHFTDHMFLLDYNPSEGWHNARIVPYAPLSIDPAAMVLHYGQAVFEGLKAYAADDGRILLFRPEMNAARMNRSNARLCIPPIDESIFMEAVTQLVLLEKAWIPRGAGQSLYVRPFVIATDPFLGVRVSDTYTFIIILSPCANYYPEGLNPVSIYVEDTYVRAVRGGVGQAKAPANYAASLKAQAHAKSVGYTQVLWLDGVERKYIEEVGTMNVFFVIDGVVSTPMLTDSILPGVTRDSIIALLRDMGYTVTERRIAIDELVAAAKDSKLDEAFGTGTAAVISPVGHLMYKDEKHMIKDGGIGPISQKLFDTLTGIQFGKQPDKFGWVKTIGNL